MLQNIDPQLIKKHTNELFSYTINRILYPYGTQKDLWKTLIPSPFNSTDSTIYIGYANTIEVWEWMTKHPKWVTFKREIQAPGGGTVTIYNHQLCNYITNNMLSSGSKTSPSVIEDKLNDHVKQQIKQMLDQNIQLPKYPKPIKNPKIKQILNSITLKNEGEKMQHCVGGYIRAAAAGHTFIFHVDDDTTHGATIEVSPTGKILQCYGVSNTPAPKARQIAEEEFNTNTT